ncbi:expressed unknown protein [Seminavis robusta]|uniref:Uncharacterized protein n=1 Tax=Seminavis robusta TaxID=568900 RepID=A0A9N8EWD6_9STRA|nr:expressed unknown protein [Seminavis robusta]|eukprot:Sro1801_g298500.1 n/a (266) ;mRNA; r:6670-7467
MIGGGNDNTVLRFSFTNKQQFSDASSQLQDASSHVSAVHLKSRGFLSACIRVSKLMGELAQCPLLQVLEIDMPNESVHTHALVAVLQASKKTLVALTLRANVLRAKRGGTASKRLVVEGLRNLVALENFSWNNGSVDGCFSEIIGAVANCPKLKSVTLTQNLWGDTFDELALNPTLEALTCSGCVINWTGRLGTYDITLDRFCQTLQTSRLKSLKICPPPTNNDHENVDMTPLANYLHHTKHLEHLSLAIHKTQVKALANGLKHN